MIIDVRNYLNVIKTFSTTTKLQSLCRRYGAEPSQKTERPKRENILWPDLKRFGIDGINMYTKTEIAKKNYKITPIVRWHSLLPPLLEGLYKIPIGKLYKRWGKKVGKKGRQRRKTGEKTKCKKEETAVKMGDGKQKKSL